MTEATVIGSWAHTVISHAEHIGVQRAELELLGAEGIRAVQATERVPYRSVLALWQAIDRIGGRDGAGLCLADSAVGTESYDILGYLLRSAADLQSCLEALSQYGCLANENSLAGYRIEEDRLVIFDGPRWGESWPAAYAQAVAGVYARLLLSWASEPLDLLKVELPGLFQGDKRPLETFFGAPVEGGAPCIALHFSLDSLKTPFRQAEPGLRRHLENRANELKEALPGTGLVPRISRLISTELEEGVPSMTTVAKRLRMSSRTLQRRLGETGTSYKDLVEAARRERALTLVRQTSTSFAECSDQCGFANPPAFTRAFRRWTGLSPAAYRQRSRFSAPRDRKLAWAG